jgi:hypothetical protein
MQLEKNLTQEVKKTIMADQGMADNASLLQTVHTILIQAKLRPPHNL